MNTPTHNLNREQQLAAGFLWKSEIQALQLIAGAGSGKTTTLIAAVSEAIAAGFTAETIGVITFSRRAAHELRQRFEQSRIVVGYCGTMHALAWRQLRKSGDKRTLLVHAEETKARIAREIFPQYSHIPQQILTRSNFLNSDEFRQLHSAYTRHLAEFDKIDFDAMVAEATGKVSDENRFQVLFVDEFQDTSPDQVDYIRSLAAQKLFVVGDDWQSIYRFRGADVSVTQNFTKHFSNSKRLYLEQNYRSEKAIVVLGNKFIRVSRQIVKKTLKAIHKTKHRPTLFFAPLDDDAMRVWARFLKKISLPAGSKITVLVRTNALRLMLEARKPANFEIITIHKSKGLEFDHVIVFGVAEHILPHRENDFDEEVRILYVALTRAKQSVGFVAWEKNESRSAFLPFFMRHCKLVYI